MIALAHQFDSQRKSVSTEARPPLTNSRDELVKLANDCFDIDIRSMGEDEYARIDYNGLSGFEIYRKGARRDDPTKILFSSFRHFGGSYFSKAMKTVELLAEEGLSVVVYPHNDGLCSLIAQKTLGATA